MSLIDDVLGGFSPVGGGAPKWMRHNLRAGEKLLREGETATGRIVGIRVRVTTDDTPDHHEFCLEYGGAGATPLRVGCRQRLGRLTPTVRLGMEVPVRHDGDGKAMIDTAAMGGDGDAWNFKPLDDPPEGIEDGTVKLDKERRRAAAARVTILAAERSSFLGMQVQNLDLHVRVAPDGGEPYETVVKREIVPFYATHLVEPGTELPGLARHDRPDKVRVDWPAAAMADPGVGRPPAEVVAADEPAEEVAATAADADFSAEALAADDHGEVGGVGFATWVQVEAGLVRDRVAPAEHDAYAQRHGVPAGAWASVQSGWQGRMMSDPRVGARFGAEYQAALKRR